jgi:2,3-bisphosphoglycerate-dependent phosphoglycerate mutase
MTSLFYLKRGTLQIPTIRRGYSMTTIYFVRHAESNDRIHNDRLRPLTEKGMRDRELVTNYLCNQPIDQILSSPYQRTLDTVKQLADLKKLPIGKVENFRERNVGKWVNDFHTYAKQQWNDFCFKLTGGESLGEVQKRIINSSIEPDSKRTGSSRVGDWQSWYRTQYDHQLL